MDQIVDFQSLVCEALGGDARIVEQPKLLTARPSAKSWAVATSVGSVVVRVSQPHPADASMNRDGELPILAVASADGLAPKALFMDTARGVLITERVPGRLWGPRDARSPRNIARIAALLRRLHALEIPPQARLLDFHSVLLTYWNTLLEQGRGANAGTTKARSRIKKLAEGFSATGPRAICHPAIHHGNIVDNGDLNEQTAKGLMLVDWEYSGVCDPIFDLASFCCHHAFSDELRQLLLVEYYGSATAQARRHLNNACVLSTYIRELWFAVREA